MEQPSVTLLLDVEYLDKNAYENVVCKMMTIFLGLNVLLCCCWWPRNLALKYEVFC